MRAIAASQGAAVRRRAVRGRDRGRRLRHGPQPRRPVPHARRAARRRRRSRSPRRPAIGPKLAELIHAPARRTRRCARCSRTCAALGLRLEQEGPPPGEGPLREQTFVLTGTLPDLTREQATERILAQGGKVTGSVSQEDELRRRGRLAGLQAREGRAARRARARRGAALLGAARARRVDPVEARGHERVERDRACLARVAARSSRGRRRGSGGRWCGRGRRGAPRRPGRAAAAAAGRPRRRSRPCRGRRRRARGRTGRARRAGRRARPRRRAATSPATWLSASEWAA